DCAAWSQPHSLAAASEQALLMAKGGEFSCPEVGTVSWPFVGIVAWPLTIEELEAGKLDAIITSLARLSQSTWRRLEQEAERLVVRWSKSWGPVLVFERLWREAELDRAFGALLSDRKLAFDVAEAVFVMVINRLTDPASKRGLVHRWLEGIYRPEAERLQLHHFYRALDELCATRRRLRTGCSPVP